MKLGILKNFKEIDSLNDSYAEACKYCGVDFVFIDLLGENWIEDIKKSNVYGLLVRVKGNIQEHKCCFDERLAIIDEELHIPIYPSRKELFLYENKKLYEYWLTANAFPHPKTHIFYRKQDALNYASSSRYPLVFKTNGGASSSGVEIVKTKRRAVRIINQLFGHFDQRLTLGKIPFVKLKGIVPIPKLGQIQKHFVIIQEFIPIKWEWRIIKIGNSYFGHQKLLKDGFASGSGRVGWVDPPKELLYMIKEVCEKGKFDSMAMDVLESIHGEYYINELQSLFGSFLPYQMRINDIPGRYIYKNNQFIFEEGEFNIINSNVLRVNDFISKIERGYYKLK